MSTNQTMQIFSIISQIEQVVENSPRPKLGGNTKRVVDVDEIYDLLGDLKVTIPEDIRRANSVLIDADNVVAHAEEHAGELVAEAQGARGVPRGSGGRTGCGHRRGGGASV